MLFVSLLLVLLAMEVAGGYLLTSLNRYYMQNFSQELATQGELLGSFLAPYMGSARQKTDLSPLISQFGSQPGESTIVVDRYGRIVGTSGAFHARLGDRLQSALISSALRGKRIAVYARNATGAESLEMALPVRVRGQVEGAVDLTELLTPAIDTINHVRQILLVATILALIAAIFLGVILSQMVGRPIRRLSGRVARLSEGRFDLPAERWPEDEIGDVGRAFDDLSSRLAETLGAIADEKAKLETVLYQMSDGLVAVDSAGTVVLSNPRAEHLLGRALRPGTSLDGEAVLGLPVGQQVTLSLPEEAGSRQVQAETALTPGQDVRVVVLHDVTEETRIEEARRRFVADVGHELRTPLTTIQSYLDTVHSEPGIEPAMRHRFVGVALAETERMVRLVKDLLTLSQTDSATLPLAKEAIAADDLVQDVLVRLQPTIAAKGMQVRTDIGDHLPRVRGDRDRLIQVLANIVLNAIEYSPSGSTLWVGAEKRGRQVTIRVVDEGPGIPEADLPHIFDRFYRVDKARSRSLGGTGLGLAIAREIARAHGGDVTITSRLGSGTEVTVTLPATRQRRRASVS